MTGDYLHRADDIDRVLDVYHDNYEIGNPVIMNHRNPTLARFVINSSGTVSLKNFPHLILGLLRPQGHHNQELCLLSASSDVSGTPVIFRDLARSAAQRDSSEAAAVAPQVAFR
jgi:hypothetical protein